MTHWQMDDQFLGHHKTKRALRAGAEALQMWVALRTYVAINLSDGKVPDEDIDDLPHAPKSPRKWLKILVECGMPLDNGSRGPGLVDPTDGGWYLHDFHVHGENKVVVEARRANNRERQQRFRQARDSRATNTPPKSVTMSVSNAVTNTVSNATPSHPIPSDPDLPETTTQRPESKNAEKPQLDGGSGRELTEKTACPSDLRLTDGQKQTLLVAMIPEWAIDQLTTRFVANYIADPNDIRLLESWRKCLSQAVCGWWNNTRTRPKAPARASADQDDTGGYGKASDWQ
jgi:hypothetical protein